ncbi:MAG: NAD(P)-dependent oxidoreductase, partial [Chitinophagaceae bacterium]|nr:NAD(P)-dependent oxidoreductase [Chitinophagaceae bacterium]
DRVTFILGDVCNRNDWAAVLAGVNIVVHLAAETGTGQSSYLVPWKILRSNVQEQRCCLTYWLTNHTV